MVQVIVSRILPAPIEALSWCKILDKWYRTQQRPCQHSMAPHRGDLQGRCWRRYCAEAGGGVGAVVDAVDVGAGVEAGVDAAGVDARLGAGAVAARVDTRVGAGSCEGGRICPPSCGRTS